MTLYQLLGGEAGAVILGGSAVVLSAAALAVRDPLDVGRTVRRAIVAAMAATAAACGGGGGDDMTAYETEQAGPPYVPAGFVYVPLPSKLECAPICPAKVAPSGVPTKKEAA